MLINKTAFIISNGCVPNKLEAKKINGLIREMGYKIVDDHRVADIIIFNTCGYSADKIKECEKLIKKYGLEKQDKARVVVTGCLNKISPLRIDNTVEKVNLSEIHNLFNVNRKLDNLYVSDNIIDNASDININNCFNIITSTGCLGRCSYCAIKKARGTIKSKPIRNILLEINEALSKGYNKYILWGDDLGAYGADISTSYFHLLRDIIKKYGKGEIQLYLHRLNPQWLIKYSRELMKILQTGMIKLIYSPTQSGSDRILKLMRRDYLKEPITEVFKRIKNDIPATIIKTDLIIGFPSESDDDFNDTMEFVADSRIDEVSIFKYGAIPHTPAFYMKNRIKEEIKEERFQMFWKIFQNLRYSLKSEDGKYKLIDKANIDESGQFRVYGPINRDHYE